MLALPDYPAMPYWAMPLDNVNIGPGLGHALKQYRANMIYATRGCCLFRCSEQSNLSIIHWLGS